VTDATAGQPQAKRVRRHLVGPTSATRPAIALPTRRLDSTDAEALAALMIDAYRGTIDDDGETIEDARNEIDGYFAGSSGTPLLEASAGAIEGGVMVAAVLVSTFRGEPLIAYLMTGRAWTRRGLATSLVQGALADLASMGASRAHLWVTAGNPAERIYECLGFVDA
jgi:GNAT superfamily N-acetyltransferase